MISSAVVGRYSFISEIKRRNSAGPRTPPCVTPAITLSHYECLLLHFTLCFLPLRYWAIHDLSRDGSILSIFDRRILWSTRSNAFAKSKNTACPLRVWQNQIDFFWTSLGHECSKRIKNSSAPAETEVNFCLKLYMKKVSREAHQH